MLVLNRRTNLWKTVTGLIFLVGISGCYLLRETSVPIQSEYFSKSADSEVLVILLPGIGEPPTAFEKNGVVAAVRQCRPNADILGVDAHFGYYRERSLDQRLLEDIIATPQVEGKRIWLLGNSLGGLGSLIYGTKYADRIEWIALMAPYLGEKEDLQAFVEDDKEALAGVDPAFIQLWTTLSQEDRVLPPTSLAFGEQDGFNYQHLWLSQYLPEGQIFPVTGKHRWSVWKELWPTVILESGYCETDA